MKPLQGKAKSTIANAHSHVQQTDITHKLAIEWQESRNAIAWEWKLWNVFSSSVIKRWKYGAAKANADAYFTFIEIKWCWRMEGASHEHRQEIEQFRLHLFGNVSFPCIYQRFPMWGGKHYFRIEHFAVDFLQRISFHWMRCWAIRLAHTNWYHMQLMSSLFLICQSLCVVIVLGSCILQCKTIAGQWHWHHHSQSPFSNIFSPLRLKSHLNHDPDNTQHFTLSSILSLRWVQT